MHNFDAHFLEQQRNVEVMGMVEHRNLWVQHLPYTWVSRFLVAIVNRHCSAIFS